MLVANRDEEWINDWTIVGRKAFKWEKYPKEINFSFKNNLKWNWKSINRIIRREFKEFKEENLWNLWTTKKRIEISEFFN